MYALKMCMSLWYMYMYMYISGGGDDTFSSSAPFTYLGTCNMYVHVCMCVCMLMSTVLHDTTQQSCCSYRHNVMTSSLLLNQSPWSRVSTSTISHWEDSFLLFCKNWQYIIYNIVTSSNRYNVSSISCFRCRSRIYIAVERAVFKVR